MAFDWNDFTEGCHARMLTVVDGIPSLQQCDIHVWEGDDDNAYLDLALLCGVLVVYGHPVTVSDQIDLMSESLAELRDEYAGAEESELDRVELELEAIDDETRNVQIGWRAQWRHEGVAHYRHVVHLNAVLERLDNDIDALILQQPTQAERHAQYQLESAERRQEQEELLHERTAAAGLALAQHPEFESCTNQESRNLLLRSLDLDVAGLNKKEILAAAKASL